LSFWGGFFKLGVGSLTLTTLEVWGDENFITEEGLVEVTLKDGVTSVVTGLAAHKSINEGRVVEIKELWG
jgi:hypothetical protein